MTKRHYRRNHQQLARATGRRAVLAGIGAAAVSASALSLLPLRSARAEAQFTLRLASWGAPTAPQVVNFVGPFQKAVEAESHGRISVQSFPAGSLVKEQAVPAAIQSRVVDISLTTMGSWASIVPTAGVLNTVFFSPVAADFEKAIGPETPLFNTLDQAMAAHGVRLLAVLYNGPVVVVSRAPMDSPAAFRGKTIRVFDRLTAQIVQALGGAPSTIEVADVYPALERGTVQGAIGGLEGAIGLKEYEVSKYLLATNGVFGLLITGYVMNRSALDALPPDLQKVVLDAGHTIGVETTKAMIAAYARELDAMRQHGMTVTVLEPGKPPYRAFTEALASLKKSQEAQFPPDLVKQVVDAQR
ncbi:MAG: TRAP transporter substrate-binding protein DctP [Alphaproteobacteria bacterium]|nr:TRAP transporter substrate-binding protein DctP [Alphaproteobacteria bacterium]